MQRRREEPEWRPLPSSTWEVTVTWIREKGFERDVASKITGTSLAYWIWKVRHGKVSRIAHSFLDC